MRIHLSADHRGFTLAKSLESWLTDQGHSILWHGASSLDEGDDYPLFTIRTAQAQLADEDQGITSRSIVVGGDGSGEVIAANKVNGARAALAMSGNQVALARQKSDISLLVLGSVHHSFEDAKKLATVFLETEFGGLLDDARRIINIAEFENSGTIEGWMIGYEA